MLVRSGANRMHRVTPHGARLDTSRGTAPGVDARVIADRAMDHDEGVPLPFSPLLDPPDLDRLRTAITGFTADSVRELIGLAGWSALERGDLAGVARNVRVARTLRDEDGLATLVWLFLLGLEVDEARARRALAPLTLEAASAAGLVERSAGAVRARMDLRPYSESAPPALPGQTAAPGADWWVVSDFGADVRPGPLAADHVLGVGGASLTLAQATPRHPVGRALDIGTGCGVQSLHLARHAGAVVATDTSTRALRFAATTAALSGQEWDLRRGSLTEPVAGERFDLVVANPPFVVSAGEVGHEYRDGGYAGDGLCEALVRGLPAVLAPGGTAQTLANWAIRSDTGWAERVEGWLDGSGCDAWVWQREVADPGEYVTMWLRDAGEVPGTPRWRERYDRWVDWFAQAGVLAVGMGMITMWRTGASTPAVVCEDVPQAVEQPVGAHISDWIRRRRWLDGLAVDGPSVDGTGDDALLSARLRAADGLVRVRHDLIDADGWATRTATLRQSHGLRWELEVDEAVAALVAACDGSTPLRVPVAVIAASLGRPTGEVVEALAPVVRDLVGRGFLLPEEL